MAYCVPIKDLKDTAAFARLVKKTEHPIFITKNGREEFVVMSTEVYRQETGQFIDQSSKSSSSRTKSTTTRAKKNEENPQLKTSGQESKESEKEVKKEAPEEQDEVLKEEATKKESVNFNDVAKMKEALAFLEEVKKHFG